MALGTRMVRSRLEQELEIVAGLSKNVMQAYGNIERFRLIGIQLPEKYKENIRSFLATIPTLTLMPI
jgi:hypothetical protein